VRDSNPQPTAFGCCSPFEPTLSQPARAGIGIRHGSAARTGRDTSPHRCCRWIDCALPPVSKRQSMASHRAAACTEAPRRRAGGGHAPAPSRLRVPCHGPAWPGCLGIARCTRVRKVLCERQNEKCPRHGIRGHSPCLGRSGRPISRGGAGQVRGAPSYANHARRPASRLRGDGMGRLAMWWRRVMVEGFFAEGHGIARIRRVRTLLASMRVCKRIFALATNGRIDTSRGSSANSKFAVPLSRQGRSRSESVRPPSRLPRPPWPPDAWTRGAPLRRGSPLR
jgi:hypothetical protein